jgi:CDP-diacylglycerol--glycerol-3-phosphate 3-phosphatidyltransferase
MFLNVPNSITLGRIMIIPILGVLLGLQEGSSNDTLNRTLSLWAALVFILAGISDLVDGYYARKYGEVSIAGKFFDPLADKLIHMTAMIFLIPLGRIEAWVVVVLLFREIFITGLRSMAAGEGMIIDAGEWGKMKTAWLNFGIGALIIHYPLFGLNSHVIGYICVAVGFLYSVLSAGQYSLVFVKTMRKKGKVL